MKHFSPAEYIGALEDLRRSLADAEKRRITRVLAEHYERILIAEARRDAGHDAAFSGWKTPSREVRALDNLQLKELRSGAHGVWPTRRSGGPWKVITQGRNQGGATGRGGAALFLGPSIDQATGETFRTASGNVRITRRRRRSKWSGYTAGKGTGRRAVSRMNRDAPTIANTEAVTVLRRHFELD